MRIIAAANMPFTDSLFFAIFPDEAARARISDIARRLRAQHNLKTQAIPAERLHITLHHLGAFDGLPADVLQQACDAASTVKLSPVDITLDRIESFSSRRAKRPLVLSGDITPSLQALVNALAPETHRLFKLHVTLLYDAHRGTRETVPEPVTWTSHEFALMRSHLSQSRHEIIARWMLNS
ncbi:putative ligase protein [Candidatus Burkholderia humilis]|nr:putative ligase protein [Candidatus Burkholderia humilis]